MYHEVKSLERAEFCENPRTGFRTTKARGVKAKGLAYERRVRKFLNSFPFGKGREIKSGQWIRYLDAGETRHAQVDHLVVDSQRGLIIECKFSHSRSAQGQLYSLYWPLIRSIFPRHPFSLVELVHHYGWRYDKECEKVTIDTLDEAIAQASLNPKFFICQWSP